MPRASRARGAPCNEPRRSADAADATVELAVPDPRQQTVLRFRGDRLVAVETVNRAGDHMLARRILTETASPTAAQAAAAGFGLKAWHDAPGLVAGERARSA